MNSFNHVSAISDLWVNCSRPNPQAWARLFCFPFAGAGASSFKAWTKDLPFEIDLFFVNLPGRDGRIREPLSIQLDPVVDALTRAIQPYCDKPVIFYGHSMGALLAFEVARRLRRQYALQPAHLFLSARRAPQLPDPHSDLYKLPDKEFLAATENLYGVLPEIVKQDHEVLDLFLSIMRADLTMLGTHQHTQEPPLDCPITVFGGLHDSSLVEAELAGWCQHTAAAFELKMFPGDHFFINNSRQEIIQSIIQTRY